MRHGFHPGKLLDGAFEAVGLVELGSYTVVWLVYALALLGADRRFPSSLRRRGGAAVAGLASVQALLAQGLAGNPLLGGQLVQGIPVVNTLLWAYGVPALLATTIAWMLRRLDRRLIAGYFAACGLALGFVLLTLEVRQAFHGATLPGPTSSAELYAYSVAWILFAAVLLGAGVAFRSAVSCYGAAPVLLLAVGKVFFVDTASLEGLYRVLSLLGLGTSLMVLAYVYQRFVFPVLRGGRPSTS